MKDKSKAFALRIVKLYKFLCEEKKEFILSKQTIRSGTSIGANVSEAFYAQSEADFISKLSIALKEAGETKYWIELLHESDYLSEVQYKSINNDITEILKLLTASIKTVKERIGK